MRFESMSTGLSSKYNLICETLVKHCDGFIGFKLLSDKHKARERGQTGEKMELELPLQDNPVTKIFQYLKCLP